MFLIVFCSTGPSVGLAWLDKLCTTGSTVDPASKQYVSGTAVSSITNTEWKVVAHEIGHSKIQNLLTSSNSSFFSDFGAVHDCISSTCDSSTPSCSSSSSKCVCCPCGSSCDCQEQFSKDIF